MPSVSVGWLGREDVHFSIDVNAKISYLEREHERNFLNGVDRGNNKKI